MSSMHDFAQDPKHRRQFEKLLFLAAKRGDADLVAERLGWGVDPNCASPRGTTPLIANIRGVCPNAATVRSLLLQGADPRTSDHAGLTALDYARRKLLGFEGKPRREPRKSPSLDENGQLILSPMEQAELDRVRADHPEWSKEFVQLYWQERMRAAKKKFNDRDEIEAIVEILERASEKK